MVYESTCIVIINGVNSVAFTSSWSASEHAKHGPASFTILILTLAANTATRIPAYIAAHFLWRTNIAEAYNPFNWHLQLSNCRTLGRASWFIHNNWSTPCLTTWPVLLRAWHIGFNDQNSATPPPPSLPSNNNRYLWHNSGMLVTLPSFGQLIIIIDCLITFARRENARVYAEPELPWLSLLTLAPELPIIGVQA